MPAGDLQYCKSGVLVFEDVSGQIAFDGTDTCANPEFPTMSVRITGNTSPEVWMGETWAVGDNDWRCICATAYVKEQTTTGDTINRKEQWSFNSSLVLQRNYKKNTVTATTFNTGKAKVLMLPFAPSGLDSINWLNGTITFSKFDLGVLKISNAAPTYSNYELSNDFFGSATNAGGVTFSWKPGAGWPVL